MNKRNSGILLHVSSLPGSEGIGTLGKDARKFIDFLHQTGQTYWQVLPLGPAGYGNSPYQCYSAFAGNAMLIDLETLVDEGLLEHADLEKKPAFSVTRVEFDHVEAWKFPLLRKAFENFKPGTALYDNDYHYFLEEHNWWLGDYAFFMAAKKHFGQKAWQQWDDDAIKFREPNALGELFHLIRPEIDFRKFLQFMFFRQWFRLKDYAHSKQILIIGDAPLYVSTDSVDIWTNTDIFLLDENLNANYVGGVPPDYFSETGQLWGNPVYNWKRIEERGFDWWLARLHFNLHMFDLVRIDHFRGLESFWSVESTEKTAIKGEWVQAKGYQLLEKFRYHSGENMKLIAEDLGVITPEVEKLRDDFNLPGMKILQFAFSGDEKNMDLPHNYSPEFFAYTGTHDNDTTLGWLKSLTPGEKKMIKKYLGVKPSKAFDKMVETVFASTAKSAIIPMQDVLKLDSKSRMNIPSTPSGNWEWRFYWNQLKMKRVRFLKTVTKKYNRANQQ